jgi:hypothetical protein
MWINTDTERDTREEGSDYNSTAVLESKLNVRVDGKLSLYMRSKENIW